MVQFAPAVSLNRDPEAKSPPSMAYFNPNTWEIGGGLLCLAALGAGAVWFVKRKRPTAEELERARRQFLVKSGRRSMACYSTFAQWTPGTAEA